MNIGFNSNTMNLANPKVRRRKFGVFSLFVLMVTGAIFTGVGLIAIRSSKINPSWIKISGKVVGSTTGFNSTNNVSSTTHAPIIQYQVNNQIYKITSNVSSSSMPTIGSESEIAYNPSQPDQAKVVHTAATNALFYIFAVVGVLCLVLSPLAFIRSIRRSKDINQLTKTGQKLQGILTNLQTTYGNNNNNTSYKLVVSATNSSGVVQNYVSDPLEGIGGLAMADYRNTPIPLDVYVNPSNPKDYYVDISEVPNLTPQRISEMIQSVAHKQQPTFAQNEQPNQQVPPVPPTNPMT